jgi:hypothetical protein
MFNGRLPVQRSNPAFLTFATLMPQKNIFKIPEPALYELQRRK